MRLQKFREINGRNNLEIIFMTTKQRLIPEWDFPKYAFIPGKFPHPNKEGGHSFEVAEPKVEALDPLKPQDSKAYLFALDLFNHGYYWESHVWWEALWNASNRRGETADFLKALIKLGAAGVKVNLDQAAAARGHIARASELFVLISEAHLEFAGFNLIEIVNYCEQMNREIPKLIENQKKLMPLNPKL